jgi:TAT (twin-arginine translocation) pathway signal sequence
VTDHVNRRQFLQVTASAAAAAAVTGTAVRGVAVVIDPSDAVAGSAPARWAAAELVRALTDRGVSARIYERAADAPAGDLCVMAAGLTSRGVVAALGAAGVKVDTVPEALVLCETRDAVWACGHDARGLTYALLELADRARLNADPVAALAVGRAIVERPANTVRSVTRLFTSDVEDKPWFNDREMWPAYLSMLAAQRFNRFSLALGIGYDFLTNVTDSYFVFSYPYVLAVPGYNVRVPQLPDAERDRNLDMLRFIARETTTRGMQFQLGIWMHGYEWATSPKANYTIDGLTKETHGPYCRDAMRALLKAVPEITGVTLRVHGESGVEEGSYEFWKHVFEGVGTCGRTVEIDMHAKGMDQSMIDAALGAGQPVKISPKYWAEHLGLPYHQADIREQERPREGRTATGLMRLSAGSRSFLRYGYGDLLREDRKWGVLHRIWPGTQRLLIWGDPVTAAAYSRAFSFCGSDGVEIMEPLSFKGRRGSGIAGGRCAYADQSLNPRWDWEKYTYSYRVWGRLLYNPATDSDVWQRAMRHTFGAAGGDLTTALASSSRILPTITTAHAPSAGNNTYWPEVYLNHSLIDAAHPGPYTDSPSPRVFGTVSPLDPQLFSRIDDCADELVNVNGERSGKYSPIEVASWLEQYAATAMAALSRARGSAASSEYRRLMIDIAIAADLGRFFAAKLRAGVLYHLFDKTGDRAALEATLARYHAARDVWAGIVLRTNGVYMPDITVGETRVLRGHWADRLADIDADMTALAAKLDSAKPALSSVEGPAEAGRPIARAIAAALGQPQRPAVAGRHTPPATYQVGQAVPLEFASDVAYEWVRLHYRVVNHAERWQSAPMQSNARSWRAEIPADYTRSPFALQYYFEVKVAPNSATLYPGLGSERTNQPYFVVRRA